MIIDWDKLFQELHSWSPGKPAVMATQLPSGHQGPRYKIGDKVKHIWGQGRADEGTVADDGALHDGIYHYWVKFTTHAMFCRENELAPLEDEWSGEAKCECGSTKTFGETGFHSSWCPKNRS